MRWLMAMLLALLGVPSWADDKAGVFDYYVLSLSWSPNWCVRTGDSRGSKQCIDGTRYGWILHGLWPQYEAGWPSDCATFYPAPSDEALAEMTDIMATKGLAAHQWRKHGTCSGLSAEAYFRKSRTAFNAISRPSVLRSHDEILIVSATDVETAFLQDNPLLATETLTVTCRGDHIQEVRICLTKDLQIRRCSADVSTDCDLQDAVLHPIR